VSVPPNVDTGFLVRPRGRIGLPASLSRNRPGKGVELIARSRYTVSAIRPWRDGQESDEMDKTVDADLLKILVCPDSKAPLIQVGDWLYSTDPATRRRYPIRDGIPIMLIDESEVLSEEEFDRIMAEHNKGATA